MAKRCIVVGLDGANPRFVLGMVEQGRLPNFGARRSSFRRQPLTTVPQAWNRQPYKL